MLHAAYIQPSHEGMSANKARVGTPLSREGGRGCLHKCGLQCRRIPRPDDRIPAIDMLTADFPFLQYGAELNLSALVKRNSDPSVMAQSYRYDRPPPPGEGRVDTIIFATCASLLSLCAE
jgi:hypothetical protein